MHIEIVRGEGAWENLAEAWNRLADESHVSTPFQRYEFQRAWWQEKGGGEWPEAELFLMLGYDEKETLVGIAPLFRANAEGERLLQFIGSHEIADFLDFICGEENIHEFLNAVMDELLHGSHQEWDAIDLNNILSESHSRSVLDSLAKARGLTYQDEKLQASPYIEIPESFDAYFEMLAGRDGQEMRRKMRRAARYPLPIELEIVDGSNGHQKALSDFFALMKKEPDKADFLEGPMAQQMELIATSALDNGWGQISFLNIGHDRAAAYLNFDFGGKIWAYNAGFDLALAELSPGWLLMAKMIDWCVEHGKREFDFMRGDEDYKYRFGGQDRFVHRIRMTRKAN